MWQTKRTASSEPDWREYLTAEELELLKRLRVELHGHDSHVRSLRSEIQTLRSRAAQRRHRSKASNEDD